MEALKSADDIYQHLEHEAKLIGCRISDLELAKHFDSVDPIGHLRDMFEYPVMKTLDAVDKAIVNEEEPCVYLCGHSLGLMPKAARCHTERFLNAWSQKGVLSHFEGDLPGTVAELPMIPAIAKLLGAKDSEVCIMNGLTVDIHMLMISFYRPIPTKYKVLMESRAFPSDHYAVESQIKLHGFDPAYALVYMEPREGEYCLRTQDIVAKIEEEGDSIALVWFAGLQYYTGQLFDMKQITEAGHQKGCVVGFDLAHAIGNVPMQMHDWNVDFAAYCSYKYLNCGAGTTGGIFVHEKHANNEYPRLQGWWSHDMKTRFKMNNEQSLIPGARGYACSNTSVVHAELWLAALEVFDAVPFDDIRAKSVLLTGYAHKLIDLHFSENSSYRTTREHCVILTPENPKERGAQLSLKFSVPVEGIFRQLERRGVICDKRLPSVVRIGLVPSYTRFEDIHRFIAILKQSLEATVQS